MNRQQSSFMTFLETNLNEPQRQAVLHQQGSLLVIAGAGSGKTRVITARIAHLISQRNNPASAILALTFTNKAAREMKERVAHFLASHDDLPFVGTFHSYAVLLLRKYGALLDLPSFTILDDEDQQAMVHDILKRNNMHKQITPRQALYQISQIKNSVDPIITPAIAYLSDLYKTYQHEKKISNCLDFDDLLHEMLRLFKKNPTFKQSFQAQVRHILVDEYQDTNLIQHELLKQMALDQHQLAIDSICAVGDQDQSIYSWRGATIANIINFQRDFGNAQLIKIEQNYRSVQPILDVANHVIQYNTQRTPKQLWSDKKGTQRIVQISCLSEYQEAELITHLIRQAMQRKSASIAILYRTHAQSRAIEEALVKKAIPYTMVGGVEFYERKEIKDLLAYLRLVVNPLDRIALLRILNSPTRGLGPQVEEQLQELWRTQPWLGFKDLLQLLCTTYQLPPQKTRTIQQFIALFDDMTGNDTPSSALEIFVQKTHYVSYINDKYEPDQAESRIQNIKELINAAVYLEQRTTPTIELFLQEVALMQDALEQETTITTTPVLLMSLHAAKGLEFDTVIIAGLEEQLLPSSRSAENLEAIEEERRLFYVGITRAQEYLFFLHAHYRYIYGQMVAQAPSRFLKELPKNRIIVQDFSNGKTGEQSYASSGKAYSSHKNITQSKTTALRTGKSNNTPISKLSSEQKTPIESQATIQWKLHQPVMHATYGVGRVTAIEPRSDVTYLTIAFKSGTKKIVATFVRPL